MNKRGGVLDIVVWIAIAMITLLVFAGIYYLHNAVYQGLTGVETTGDLNVSNITETVFAPATENMLQGLNILGFIILAGGAFSILAHNFLVRRHPAWIVVYIIITILAIIFAAYISNEYMELLGNDVIGSTLAEFTMGNFIMQWLPYWAAIIGILGGVFLFIGALRERDLTGGLV